MPLFRLVNPSSATAHEDVFMLRYAQLLAWALPLKEGENAAAEDLVHDAFLQFTLARPDLACIENLDGYLRQMLRNLHISQVRRAAQKHERPLCLADYDSAELSLRSEQIHAGLSARQELQLICEYALARRFGSKAGSVLLLRFFHGFLPAEIARLMGLEAAARRGAVKQWLSLARREARQYLHEPQSLKFIGALPEADAPPLSLLSSSSLPRGADDLDFLRALRAAIFAAPQPQACLSARQLKSLYRTPITEPIETPLLAHLVCCARCLEQVNTLLRMEPLTGRFPDDPGSAAADQPQERKGLKLVRGRPKDARRWANRRRAETLEHYPTELHVYANGFCVATHTVEAAHHRLALKIHLDEPLAFIEIFSEQGVRLLYLPVGETPAPALKQSAHLELSEQRQLDATLSFAAPWPTLELNYTECGVRKAEGGLEEVGDCGVRSAECGLEERVHSTPLLFAPLSQSQGLLDKLKSALRTPNSAFSWLLRPITITVLLALVLIAVVVGQKLGWWFAPAKPATTPLRRAVPSGKTAPENLPTVAPAVISPANTPTVTPVVAPSAAPALATAELEVEALRLLQVAGADLGEQLEVKRSAQGQLLIEGLVETQTRKAELMRTFASIAHHPAVVIRIETVAEAMARQRTASNGAASNAPDAASRIEVEKTALPIAAELRAYLQTRGGATNDEDVHNLAVRLHNQAHRAMDHLYALQRLSKQITPAQCDALEPAARTKYLGLLAGHAHNYGTKTRRLREELAALLPGSAAAPDAPDTIHNTAELYRAIAQLCALGKSADAVLDQALTISNQSNNAMGSGAAIKSASFWRTLAHAETLAARIESYTQKQPLEREQ
jgi:DNA-directed RNA polymerase specialized sigma24 family protein